jgi:hypothetical protein
MPVTIRWSLLAVTGLLVATTLTFAASSLSSQKVTLSDEPITALTELAPPGVRPLSPSKLGAYIETVTVPALAPGESDGERSDHHDRHYYDNDNDDD